VEFPGGKIEKGETAEEYLSRELDEEFGIEAIIGDFFMDSIYQYERGAIRLPAYYVDDLVGEFIPSVHEEIKWVHVETLLDYDLAPADIPIAEALVAAYT
jgi:8-oxo-dGTP diphosphatase